MASEEVADNNLRGRRLAPSDQSEVEEWDEQLIKYETDTNDDDLPPGWTRKIVQRQTGKSAGKYDTYIYSPGGKKFRSRQELQRYLDGVGSDLSADHFDFYVKDGPRKQAVKAQVKRSRTKEETAEEDRKRVRRRPRQDDPGSPPEGTKSPKKKAKRDKLLIRMNFHTLKKPTLADGTMGDSRSESDYENGNCSINVARDAEEVCLRYQALSSGPSSSWRPPRSPYNLVQEILWHDPWATLLSTVLLQRTKPGLAIPKLWEFLLRWPNAQAARNADYRDIAKLLQPLGLHKHRAKIIVRFSDEFLSKKWSSPHELYGLGKLGDDTYRVFCVNEWEQVKPDDHALALYHRWLSNNNSSISYPEKKISHND